METFVSSDMSI